MNHRDTELSMQKKRIVSKGSSDGALSWCVARIKELETVLEWYGEQARLARLIHSEGDAGRHALAMDGGKKARATLDKSERDV
jgi:hypothetical protein